MLLRSVAMKPSASLPHQFPFTLPFVKPDLAIAFDAPVTLLVGDNGSGKSTFLEALACAIGASTIGSASVLNDPTLAAVRVFAEHLKLVWSKRTRRGFFLRSEDFFGFAKQMIQIQADMRQELQTIEKTYQNRSPLARSLAELPYRNELGAMQRAYGESLDHYSHGEAFFRLFQERLTGEGVYLLDEPEAPLSPTRQLAFLTLLKQAIERNGQCIIATHSPILMAYPNATILLFEGDTIRRVAYDEVEHVSLTRAFLNDPQRYLHHLLAD